MSDSGDYNSLTEIESADSDGKSSSIVPLLCLDVLGDNHNVDDDSSDFDSEIDSNSSEDSFDYDADEDSFDCDADEDNILDNPKGISEVDYKNLFVNALETEPVKNLSKEPPKLLGIEEYQIAVTKCVANGLSWKETFATFFQVDHHPQIEKVVRKKYFTILSDHVIFIVSEIITKLCCSRADGFSDLVNKYTNPDIHSGLWKEIINKSDMTGEAKKLLLEQLFNFTTEENRQEDINLQKKWDKSVSYWRQVINHLAPHFFNDSVENQFLSCIFNWFIFGDISIEQRNIWRRLYKDGKATNLASLRGAHWPQGDEYVQLFVSLLDDILTPELSKQEELKGFLQPFVEKPVLEPVDGGRRILVKGKGYFLSDVISDILKVKETSSVEEVNIYSKYFLGIDCDLKTEHWHGTNFTIITEKLTIWRQTEIDVSGNSLPHGVRKAAERRYAGGDGTDGTDGRAGESAGNVVILANQVRNPEYLTVKLNGGCGEGGQNGGAGADGRKGISTSKENFNNTILKYTSLYRDKWSNFENYSPGSDWKIGDNYMVNKKNEQWIYRTYTHNDGREMIYSFAGDCGWYTSYDIMFHIKGTDGSMGGHGGKNGVSGEGGNAGEFKARTLRTLAELNNFKKVEMMKGKDGEEGTPGASGNPGSHGNHMAMVDRSSGSINWINRSSQHFFGESQRDRLEIKHEFVESSTNALNGLKKHKMKESDYYTTFCRVDMVPISEKKETEKRTSSERTSKSQAISKQTISIETLLEEFAEICEGDELNIGDVNDFKQFDIDKNEEEEEQVQEEISVVRTFVENSQEHEKNLRRAIATPDEVVKEIKETVSHIDKYQLVDLIDLWKKIFTVPLSFDILEQELTLLFDRFCNCSYENYRSLSNGISKRDFDAFRSTVKDKFFAKKKLSTLEMTLNLDAMFSTEVINEKELSDVASSHLEQFWIDGNQERNIKKLLNPLFEQVKDNDAKSSTILLALYSINKFLKTEKDVFQMFDTNYNLNWAEVPSVQEYLKNFLTENEKKLHEKIEKEQKEKRNQVAENFSDEEDSESEQETEETGYNLFPKKKKTTLLDSLAETEKEIRYSIKCGGKKIKNFLYIEVTKPFKNVTSKFKSKEGMEQVFEQLTDLLKDDKKLMERFCIEKSTITNQLKPPGSSPQSLVHLFFLTEQILNFNVRLYRYYLPYESGVTVPNDWYIPNKDIEMNSVIDLINWSEDLTKKDKELPKINSDMKNFIKRNGIKCRAYRQMIADHCKVNIQVFCESGYCKMRLVENLNPEYTEIRRLIIKNGELYSVAANEPLRKLRAVMDTCQLNIPLPLSEGILNLTPYFPDSFKSKVEEWTAAAVVATGSEVFPRFLQRLFELRGNSMSIVNFQFAINTIIEANRNFEVPLEALCNRILAKDGVIRDIFLALRVTGSMKGSGPKFESLVDQLSEIKEPRLKALFGSKLHEMELNDTILTSLVNMLSHADDRVAQLEKMHLREWLDIANCQRWKSYGPLLEKYGYVGYYIVLLNTAGRKEGDRLERIISDMKNSLSVCIILENIISKLTFLINNNEVKFDDQYEAALSKFLHFISKKCIAVKQEEIDAKLMERHLKREDIENEAFFVKTDNIYFITNEVLQNIVLRLLKDSIADELQAVLPKEDRSLKDLIHLSINPQDNAETKANRQKDMAELEGILVQKSPKDVYAQILNFINEMLHSVKNIRLRDTQKIAILSAAKSNKNLLSQVNTGEGKSYIIACLAILKILVNPKDTVDIITSSSVLAQRDAESMKEIYEAFGIKVGHNCDEDVEKRKLAYKCGVVYGDITRFERDYLLQTFYKKNILGDRTRSHVIVDEVDSMLLDNGSNMLYLSHNVPGLEMLDSLFVYLHKLVNTPSLAEEGVDANLSSANLRKKVLADMCGLVTKEDVKELLFDKTNNTSVGRVWRILTAYNIIDSEGVLKETWNEKKLKKKLLSDCGKTLTSRVFAMLEIVKNRRQEIGIPAHLKPFVIIHLDDFIKNAKQGLFLRHNDEYVVDLDHTGRATDLHPVITIIDKGTGTDLSTSQWGEGLHQFLQLKHGCRLTSFSLKAVFISNVTYLMGYKRLNGFSGTLGSIEESNSLIDLYNADMLNIPTWKPKSFNENAPILANKREEWLQTIFDKICDQLIADRSVLVICQSIAEVKEFDKEFRKLYQNLLSSVGKVIEGFDKVIVYTREFDDVDFSDDKPLPCCRLIISTNLAGRGTDIKLCDDLIKAGGLHVIISFLPENSRIENQAYGRAARCGQPGSGQIICLVHEEDNGANNIFQLKQFRDNSEVHRLRSLKQFYNYQIEVEETCLRKFQDHCNRVMESVHSTSKDLTVIQVIYFALLDKWALWLDAKAKEIHLCEKNKNDVLKAHIISSVEDFLKGHPLPNMPIKHSLENYLTLKKSSLEGYEASLAWIKCPQPLLSIAQICIQDGDDNKAVEVLSAVSKRFPEFEAEACYYKGIIKQRHIFKNKFKKFFKIPEQFSLYNYFRPDKLLPDKEAIQYFLLSRSIFASRIQKKHDMTRIIQLLQQKSSIVSKGFAAQQEEAIAVLECFIGNIDDILGHKAKPEDVRIENEAHHLTIRRFKEFIRQADIITPPQLINKISEQQYNILAANHCLPVNMLKQSFKRIYSNNKLIEYDGHKVVVPSVLAEVFSIPSIRGFWESLRRAGCFFSEQVFIAVKKTDIDKVSVLKNIEITDLTLNSLQIQLSTKDLSEYYLYDVHGEAGIIKEDGAMNAVLQEIMEAGLVHIEAVATINPLALIGCHLLDQFSYISVDTVSAELNISTIEATWIMETLAAHGVVEKIVAEVEYPPTPEEIDAMNKALLEQQTDPNQEEIPKPNETIVIYAPTVRISCKMLPSNMRPSIEMMLSRNFCYHYALQNLKTSIIKAVEGEKVSHQICLPTDPFADLYDDLQNLGIIQHSRVTSVLTDIYQPNEDGILNKTISGRETRTHYIHPIIYENLKPKIPKLTLRKCTLDSTADYLREKNVPASGEIRKVVSNGLGKVASFKKNWWKWILGIFIVVSPLILVAIYPVVTLPFFLLAMCVCAAVGTVLYCIYLMVENQKIASTLNFDHEEEFKMLREYHGESIAAPKRIQVAEKQKKLIDQSLAIFIKSLEKSLIIGTLVTDSQENIGSWVKTLEMCCQNSIYLPYLKQSIEQWFMANVRKIQEAQLDLNFNWKDQNFNLTSPKALFPPSSLFVFSSLLISDINARKRSDTNGKKAITTKLDFKNYPRHDVTIGESKENYCPLSNVLSKSLKDILKPMIDEAVISIVHPAFSTIDVAWRRSHEEEIKEFKHDEKVFKNKQFQHSAERLAQEERVDFLAADLHNIFQRIAFTKISTSMLQHMILYNYPLSPHCAKYVFDSCVTILQSIDDALKQVNIELKRDEQTIFTYCAIKHGSQGNMEAETPLILGLERDSFYIVETNESVNSHKKYCLGLFQALCEYSNKFCDKFALDQKLFIDTLHETLDIGLDESCTSEVKWNGNEKLICAVAIW